MTQQLSTAPKRSNAALSAISSTSSARFFTYTFECRGGCGCGCGKPPPPPGEPTGWWWGPDTPCASGFPSPFSEPKLPGRLRMAEGPPGGSRSRSGRRARARTGARAWARRGGRRRASRTARGRADPRGRSRSRASAGTCEVNGRGGASSRGASGRGMCRSAFSPRRRPPTGTQILSARDDGSPNADAPRTRTCAPTTDPARSRRGKASRDDVRGWRARAPGCACGATPGSTTPASNEATKFRGRRSSIARKKSNARLTRRLVRAEDTRRAFAVCILPHCLCIASFCIKEN